ncbi:MAG: bifunctional 2-dehydro-3-deoxygluconokinase/2-dehydro-3-deoxygalactonokinase [Thermoprotei archaeon]
MRIAAVGEPLIQLNSMTRGPLRYVKYFEKHVAGSELNFLIAAMRNGADASLIARVGDDEFGIEILEYARGLGIDVSAVKVARSYTGFYFVQRGYPVPGRSELVYHRSGSAGSSISPSDVERSLVSSAELFHTTGITAALSESALAAVRRAFQIAKKISFDTNIRLRLWSAQTARSEIMGLLAQTDVDYLITDPDDSQILIGERDPHAVYSRFRKLGVKVLVYKVGSRGAYAFAEGEQRFQRGYRVSVEDPTGAGDALAGTFVSLHMAGRALDYALAHAVAASALVVTVRGDNEIIPTEADAQKTIDGLKG